MLVYGDPWRMIDLAAWRARAAAPLPRGPWIVRHAEIAERLIEGGQVLQALQDAAFAHAAEIERSDPRWTPLQSWLGALARHLMRSFDHRETPADLPEPPLLPSETPAKLRAREPEGYAFYALYPEAYGLAARSIGASPDALVIGLRSIGCSLAPVVAAGLGAPGFTTVRPKGDVFKRSIAAPELGASLASRPSRLVAIVDEGPGLSGSSFAGVAGFVRAHAPKSDIRFVPSHTNGPGAEASTDVRDMFASIPQHVGDFDPVLRADLPDWVADLTGPALAPMQEISGGEWRRRVYASEEDWPAVDPSQERRKFLLRSERGEFLLKFAGVGAIGARKARMAAMLGDAGLAPEVLGFRHGFLVERWRADARPLDPRRDRAILLPALARYVAFRRARFACDDAYGASVVELSEMVARNAGLALGPAAAELARARMAPLTDGAARLSPVATDNRMQAHEWLVTHDGAVLKTDGVDHHAAHDLIGAQDVIFDIAGASVEFDLSRDEAEQLCRSVENDSGQSVARGCIGPMRIVWLAFELGRFSFAESACGAGADRNRASARRQWLIQRLQEEIGGSGSSTVRELQSHTVVWPT